MFCIRATRTDPLYDAFHFRAKNTKDWFRMVREQLDIDPLSIFGCGVKPVLFEGNAFYFEIVKRFPRLFDVLLHAFANFFFMYSRSNVVVFCFS